MKARPKTKKRKYGYYTGTEGHKKQIKPLQNKVDKCLNLIYQLIEADDENRITVGKQLKARILTSMYKIKTSNSEKELDTALAFFHKGFRICLRAHKAGAADFGDRHLDGIREAVRATRSHSEAARRIGRARLNNLVIMGEIFQKWRSGKLTKEDLKRA